MSARARTISIVLVIVAIGVMVWKCRRSHESPPVDAAISVPLTKARLKLRDLAHQQPGTVQGKVSGDDKLIGRAAIAGALVCRRPSEDLDDIRCVATDAAGHYQLGELRPGAYQLWASAAGFAGVRWHERDTDKLTLKAGESKTGIDLVLPRGTGEIAGHVRDTRGRVLGGALIHVRIEGEPIATTRTDDEGGFHARVDGSTATVEASAGGHVDASTQTVVPATGIELVLLPEATLSGIVVETGTRAPIADARVTVEGARVTSADDGTFRVTKLKPGRYKAAASSIGGYGEATESVLLRVGAHVEGVVIEVHPVAVVAGKIVIEGGAACPEGDGNVQLERRGSREYAFGRSIVDGDVLIEGVVPGTYGVHATCTGFISDPAYPDLVVAGTDVEDVVWKVRPGAQVTGRVRLKSGAPAGDALVTIGAGLGLGARLRTAPDGTFAASGLPIGEVIVEAVAVGVTGSDSKKVTTSLAAPTRVELVLAGDKTGGIAGTVIDRRGQPVANQRVEVRTGDDTGPTTTTDLRGEFAIQGLDPGAYNVVVESKWQEGYSSSRVLGTPTRVTVSRDATARVQLQIDTDTSRITGTVVDSTGAPIADVAIDVALTSPDVEPRRRDYERTLAWTSATGAFEITGLPDHALAVRAQIAGANEVVVDNVQPGQHVRLVLKPTGSLSGVVIDPSGASVDDIFLEVEDRAQDISRKERLFHTGGKFTFRELPAGTYRLTADEDRQTSITVTIADGERRDGLQLALRPRHSIKGRLVSAEGKPLANYKLEVPHKESVEPSGERVTVTYEVEYGATDARGEFLIQGLVGSEVTISAGDLSTSPDPKLVEVKTVPLTGPPTIDLGDLVMPKP